MRFLTFTILFFIINVHSVAQSDSTASDDTFTFGITHDAAFGFYPAVFGNLGIKKNYSFTYYGTFWTNHAYAANDQSHWLETGVGLGFAKGNWYVNPQLGITSGVLLSGASEGKIAEGIVPSVLLLNTTDNIELEYYGCIYKYTKKRSELASDFLLTWLYAGRRITPKLSGGLHAETFYQLTAPNATSYGVVGGYLKLIAADKYSFRFSAGGNLMNNGSYAKQFYRLGVLMPFH